MKDCNIAPLHYNVGLLG